MKKYYDILKDLREDRDSDQKNVAKAMGIDTSYYGKYERGVHPLPIERLIFLCKFYNVSADYILADCINTHENVCENEFAEQIKECTLYESRIIIDMVKALREILRENAFTKRNSK